MIDMPSIEMKHRGCWRGGKQRECSVWPLIAWGHCKYAMTWVKSTARQAGQKQLGRG